MDNLMAFLENRPFSTGLMALVMGWGAKVLVWMKMVGEAAGYFGMIFGSIASFFGMLIVIRRFFKEKNPKTSTQD